MEGCAGGGNVALWITGVQNTKKEMAKILPVDGADTYWGGQYGTKSGVQKTKNRLPTPF